MKNVIFYLIFVALYQPAIADTLKETWQLNTGLSQPESVIYDAENKLLLVSNVAGSGMEHDAYGYISKVSMDGKLLEKYWIAGLDAPKGLFIKDRLLYVSDIDKLVVIDLESGSVSARYIAEGAKFLNDIAIDSSGNVYVSDMLTDRIYRLSGETFALWLESSELESPNGLRVEGNDLLVATWGVMTEGFKTDVPGALKRINLDSKQITSVSKPLGNLDGLEPALSGKGWTVTDWMAGKLWSVNPQGKTTQLLDLDPGSADHETLPEQELVIIPMMQNDSLKAYSNK